MHVIRCENMHTCEFCIQVWLCWCRIIFGSVRMLIAVKPCNQLIARGCSNFRSDFECCCHKIFDKIKFQDPWTTTEKNPEGVKSTHTQKRLPFFSWRWNLCVYFLRSFRLNLRVFSASIVGSSEISLESSIWRLIFQIKGGVANALLCLSAGAYDHRCFLVS